MEIDIPTKEFTDGITDYTQEYLHRKNRFNVLMWHRGSRKTAAFLNKLIIRSHVDPGLYWYIGPFLKQARETVWTDPSTYIFRWLNDKYLKDYCRVNKSDLSITFPNKSVIQILGADNPDALRGPKPKGVTVDEYGEIARRHGSKLRDEILEPSVFSVDGWIDYGGTPKGNNDFSNILDIAKIGKNKDWWGSLKTVQDTTIYTKDQIDNIRANATNMDRFEQEYNCKIIEGAASVFKGIYKCINGVLLPPMAGHQYVFGLDLARRKDRTVLLGFDLATNHLVYFQSIENRTWDQQKTTIKTVLLSYGNPQTIADGTGMGDSFIEQLIKEGLNIYSYKIESNAIKRNLIERLATYIENQYITYPDIADVLSELSVFEFDTTDSGNIVYSAPSGKHDDIVMAMALAITAMNPKPIKIEKDPYAPLMKTDGRTGYIA